MDAVVRCSLERRKDRAHPAQCQQEQHTSAKSLFVDSCSHSDSRNAPDQQHRKRQCARQQKLDGDLPSEGVQRTGVDTAEQKHGVQRRAKRCRLNPSRLEDEDERRTICRRRGVQNATDQSEQPIEPRPLSDAVKSSLKGKNTEKD